MLMIVYEPASFEDIHPSREIRGLSFWLGAQADDGRDGPFRRANKAPKAQKAQDPMAAPFKIVVGGVYRCRDGWLVHIHRRQIGPLGQISFFGSRISPITSQASREEVWESDGTFSRALYGKYHDYTICAPYVQPQES